MELRHRDHPRIAFTIGDVNGIGPEVLARALAHDHVAAGCEPVIVGNRRLVHSHLSRLSGIPNDLLDAFEWIEFHSDAELRPGEIDAGAGRLAGRAIEWAARAALDGTVDAIVTMPINKAGLHAGGFSFPGHTEMLAAISGGEPLMILMAERIRVALATIHVPISAIPSLLTPDLLTHRITQFGSTLRQDFRIERPRIAVLGLNPHAGEGGLIGREETTVITPAITALHDASIQITGPHPADGFFARYDGDAQDGVLAMYHDQGLIPLKMLALGAGVNFTACLPIVRTSPDHGTAYPIACMGIADERSTVEAIAVAREVVANRSMRHFASPAARR